MKIELLYFDGCPSWKNGLKNLKSALEEEDLSAPIDVIEVKDNEQANQLKFLGSPSFRVDGQELWPEERETYELSCRVFPSSEGIKGFPTVTMLRGQLKQLRKA
jgi:hypothetical protein